jgi:hypothetical protein
MRSPYIIGSPDVYRIEGDDADNIFIPVFGGKEIQGYGGFDTVVVDGNRADYSVSAVLGKFHTIWTSMGKIGAEDGSGFSMNEVERIQFADGVVAMDVDGTAGKAHRLYQAAFDREPDAEGAGSWVRALDAGMDLLEVSRGFVQSEEFALRYGQNPSNEAFVTALYNNVLDRSPDGEGYEHQVNALEQGLSREQLLVNFSESYENYYATRIEFLEQGLWLL